MKNKIKNQYIYKANRAIKSSIYLFFGLIWDQFRVELYPNKRVFTEGYSGCQDATPRISLGKNRMLNPNRDQI